MNEKPTKNVFLSSVSLKPQPEKKDIKPVQTKTAKDVIGKRPHRRNPYNAVKNTDGLNNVEINGINLSGIVSAEKLEKARKLKEQQAKTEVSAKQDTSVRRTTYSTDMPVQKPKPRKYQNKKLVKIQTRK